MPCARPVSFVNARRGVTLIVVLSLLTLFAVLGLSFVLYANSQALSSDLLLQSEADANNGSGPDVNPDTLASTLLSAFLYGQDDVSGVYSAFRGHDLGRSAYGFNYQVVDGKILPGNNSVPFNGSGRAHEPITFMGPRGPVPIDGYTLVNYTCFQDAQGHLIDGFLRDPERTGVRTAVDISKVGAFAGGLNVPWTYADLNNMFLAAVKADGTVLTPSFHRYWTGFGSLDPANPNWYDTTQPWLKYQVMRPRPADHLLANEIWDAKANMPLNVATQKYRQNFFPAPGDAGGDVKNLMGAPGWQDPQTGKPCNNDSVWIDFGFPVITARDGRKYKPLAAVMMLDLDNRVNVNVHGNIRGVDPNTGKPMHVSNQGWGPWEVSLSAVLNGDASASTSAPQEWLNLFTGRSGPTFGRYGPDGQPATSGASANPPLTPRFFSALDIDATKTPNYYPSDPLAFPGSDPANAPATFPFPYFPSASYSNGDSHKLRNHPALYGYFQQTGDDRQFPITNMEALLRYGDVGTDSLRSELLSLCPQNFTGSGQAARRRNLVTTLSMDLDRPGCIPWARSPAADPAAAPYSLGSNAGGPYPPYPTGGAMPAPTLSTAATPTLAGNSEFGSDGRSLAAALGRIDLNRQLTSYPPLNNQGAFTSAPDQAIADRVQLARDIYDRLRLVTMGELPAYIPPPPAAGTLDVSFEARRWLAQLAVNIVDFIDEDDYMTPFNWYTDPAGQQYFVFGTELPRVVLNEAYAEYVNDPSDPDGDTAYRVNFWVELFNSFAADPARKDSGAAVLQAGSTPIYQMAVVENPDNSSSFPNGFTRPDNSIGALTNPATGTPIGTPRVLLNSWGSTTTIQPCNKQSGPNGFYVVGPPADFQGGNGSFTPTLQADSMSVVINSAPDDTPGFPIPSKSQNYGIYLQRLACPALPPQDKAYLPNYNPYVTVDYIPGLNPAYAFTTIKTRPQAGSSNAVPITNRASFGRTQPYGGDSKNARLWQSQATAQTGQPNNTFFGMNDSLKGPFEWLVHMDRPLISPAEVLNVSAYKPHELTQKFINSGRSQQRLGLVVADENSRLYRAFEFFTVHGRAIESTTGGRVPGKINLNTVWDFETFQALCDAQAANGFKPSDVQNFFASLVKSRTPSTPPPGSSSGAPGPNDRPFLGFSAPLTPSGGGINDTLFRLSGPSQGMLETSSDYPAARYELLNKIYNNVTTRGNVFAVWVTVGFFEVLDDSTRPVKLGAEIGLSQHQNIRHRLFAIIDRTNLHQSGPAPVFVKANSPVVSPGPVPQSVSVHALSGSYEGTPWSIQPGTQLVVDVGPSQEGVTVTNVSGTNQFQAVFTKPHPQGFLINLNSLPGNPGPQQNYDPRQDSGVIRYYSIIN